MLRSESARLVVLAALAVSCVVGSAVVELDMVVTGRATLYAGLSNQDPEQRMFYTMAHFNASGMLLSVDSGSRWPWVYTSGERHCSLLKEPYQSIPCPDVPTYSVTEDGVQKNNSMVMFKYGALFCSADPDVSAEGGYFTDTWDFALTNSTTVPVMLDSFVGINRVLMNTPILVQLESGIFGCGPPCFHANDTDTPCEPFFLGQLSSALDTEEVFSYALEADPATIATGALTIGSAISGSVWQSLSSQAFSQGLWYIEVDYAIGNSAFAPCIALVDTGGGPTYLPITDTWNFGRDCSDMESLPTYYFRLPDTGTVLEMAPEDYIIRMWDEQSSSYTCESSTLFASSTASNEQHAGQGIPFHQRHPATGDGLTPICVIGMWTAVKYSLSFSWKAGAEGVAFSAPHY